MNYRIENSPEFEAKMNEWSKKRKAQEARQKRQYAAARKAWDDAGRGWLPMSEMPFLALAGMYDLEGAVLVSDGVTRALVKVHHRFGKPMFWMPNSSVISQSQNHLGKSGLGSTSPPTMHKMPSRIIISGRFFMMTYAGGEETGKEEIGFLPTIWTFLPEPPRTGRAQKPELSTDTNENKESA